jgi:hypothetical protein
LFKKNNNIEHDIVFEDNFRKLFGYEIQNIYNLNPNKDKEMQNIILNKLNEILFVDEKNISLTINGKVIFINKSKNIFLGE